MFGCILIMQLVMCLVTDVSLTTNPGVASSILGQSYTFMKIEYEIISMVILHSSAE